MDQRVEPPSWLPEGAAPEAGDEVTVTANGSGQPDGAGEQQEHAASGSGAGSGPSADGAADAADSPEAAADGPAEAGADGPGELTVESPAEAAIASPAETAVDSSGETAVESPAGTVVDGPGEATAAGTAAAEQDLSGQDTVSAGGYPHPGDPGETPDWTAPAGDDVFSRPPAGSDVFSRAPREEVTTEAEPFSYGQAWSYSYDQGGQHDFHQETPYPAEYPAGSGYNHEVMSEPAGDPPVPPYPAEVPSQPATAASSVPALASAAYRALPKPKLKTRPAAKPKPKAAGTGGRRANLVIARLEPWSVMKFSFLMSLVAWVVLFVAVALLYYLLSGIGVFSAIQKTLTSVTSSQTSAGVDLSKWTSPSRILGYTMLIGAVNIVIITALSTVGAMIYNLVTHLGGGIEVTLRETD